jgi:hypothetical protein
MATGEGVFVVKYDSDGYFKWINTRDSLNNEQGYKIGINQNTNDIYVIGSFNIILPQQEVFIVKYNSNGIEQWKTKIDGPDDDEGRGI